MRRVLVWCAVAAALVGSVVDADASAAGAHPPRVRIISLPGLAVQGGLQRLSAGVRHSASCSLTIRYANGRRQALGDVASDVVGGREWFWGVPADAAVGRARARVACGDAGARTGTFVVKRRHPSIVAVVKRGFTQQPENDGRWSVSWGVVLRNRSHREARDVQLFVNFLDRAGNVVLQDGGRVAGIAPGGPFYEADEEFTVGFPRVAQVVVSVRVGHLSSDSLVAPAVADVQVSADSFDGSARVDGEVTNEGSRPLAALTPIFAVLFDSAGKVIGGNLDFPQTALPPGAQTHFTIDTGPGGPPASRVARVGVSVDPDYSSG